MAKCSFTDGVLATAKQDYGTIIRTGITSKKIFCYMRNSACRWLIVENARIFWSYVKTFWIFPREIYCRILIGLCKQVFMNHPIMFLDRDNKTKLVPASFSYFLELNERKMNFNLRWLTWLIWNWLLRSNLIIIW